MKFKSRTYFNTAFLIGLFLLPASLFSQSMGIVSGKISDSANNLKLEGVIVSIQGTQHETISNGAGEYIFRNVAPGDHTLQFIYVGLEAINKKVTVVAGQRAYVNLNVSDEVYDMGEMSITGSLIGQARALNIQKSATTLKNVVASDAFGRFPDQNAAEILSRLPGVSVELDQGEGRYVVIRGIDPDLSNVSVDGVAIPSPESNTRRVALDVIPSDILDTLEVTKSVTPDMDGDTIGGSVNIKTKSAFDYEERVLQGTIQGQYSDLVGEFSGKVNLTYGDVFNDGKIGWISSVSYQERDFGSDNNEVDGPWDEEDGFYFAPEIEFREYVITRKRLGIASALEFKPQDDQLFYIRGIYNEFSDQEYRYRTEIKFDNDELDDYEITEVGEGTASVINTVETDRDLKDRYEEQSIYSLSAGGEVATGDWTSDFQASYSRAQEDEPNRLDSDFRTPDDQPQNYSYDFSDNSRPKVSYNGGTADPFDPSSFEFDGLTVENNITRESEFSLQYNLRKDMNFGDNPGYLKTGIKYRSKEKMADNELMENDDEPDFDLSDFYEYSSDYPYFNDPDGNGYLRVNASEFRSYFESNRSAFALERSEEDSMVEDYESQEDILAAYLMAGVSSGDWDWTGGLRVENTQFESTGLEAIYDDDGDFDPDASFLITSSKKYTDLLPGIHGKYTPDEQRVFRVSINKSLARPKFGDSANRRVVDLVDGEEIIQGNPDLNPYQSWNFDLSFEYYLPSLGIVSASGFAKKIDDFIFQSKTQIPNPNDPSSEVDFITPVNGRSAELYGLELAYVQPIEVIEGLSIYSNLTFIESEAKLPTTADRDGSLTIDFPGTSDLLGTLAVSYDNYGFFFRVAGSYRSSFLQAVGGSPIEDEFIDDHFQWDISTSYKLAKNLTIFAEVVNLNDAPYRAYYGETSLLRQSEEYSWSANFGIKWNL